jgi:hypothetical protein
MNAVPWARASSFASLKVNPAELPLQASKQRLLQVGRRSEVSCRLFGSEASINVPWKKEWYIYIGYLGATASNN